MEDLAFVSTKDLIGELMRRTTFAGMIIYSPEHQRQEDQTHNEFHLLTTACKEDTIEVLEKVLETARRDG